MAVGASRDLTLNLHEKRTGNALAQTARDLDKLAKGADASGDSMAGMSRDASRLNVEIEETSARIKQLARDFDATGDQSIFGDLSKERSHLKKLQAVLGDLAEDAHDAGRETGRSFARGMQGGMSTPGVGPALVATLGKLAVAAAPGIGAIIAGAVTGAAGVGGIAGGIAAASRDPQVRTAAKQFGEVISEEFFRSGRSFVDPTRQALRDLEGDFEALDLGDSFARAAPAVEILADGIGDFARNIMPGFNRALDRSPEAMAVIAEGLGDMGDAFSEFFADLAESEGTMDGLRALFAGLNDIINIVGNSASWLGDRFHDATLLAAGFTGAMEDIATGPAGAMFKLMNNRAEELGNVGAEAGKKIGVMVGAVDDGTRAAAGHTRATQAQAEALDTLRGAVEAALTSELSLDQANLGVARATQDLTRSLKDNGKEWDVNTQKGLDNSSMLLAKVEALGRQRQARINQGVDAEKANAMYDKEIAKLVAFGKRMGMTKKQIGDLIGDHYVRIHFKVDPLPRYTIHPSAVLAAKGRADGGPVEAGVPYKINERGRETVTFPANGQVHPANLTPVSTGGGGRMQMSLSLPPGLERGLVRAIVEALRIEIKAVGGSGPNNVQRALG
jgi:hypothetical protein